MKSESRISVWKCGKCDKEFKYESEKRRHEQSHEAQFSCKHCSKKFSFLSALRRHEKQHDRTGSVECTDCGKTFKDSILLKRHKEYAHKEKHTCSKCASTYNSSAALQMHMKTHQSESERRYKCTHKGCSKSFNFAHHLKHHILAHDKDRPHVCQACGKGFIQLHHLKVHQRSHKPDSWISCPLPDCKKKFTNEYALKRHLTTHKPTSPSYQESSPQTTIENKEPVLEENLQIDNNTSKDDNNVHISDMEEFSNLCVPDNDENYFNTYHDSNIGHVNQDLPTIDSMEDNDEISNCKSVLGQCIASSELDSNENCLCAQMGSTSDDIEEMSSINKQSVIVENVNIIDDSKCAEKRRTDANACESCECASTCEVKNKYTQHAMYEIPELESRNDGIIKIKDTFDLNYDNNQSSVDSGVVKSKAEFKHFNSVLNNCRDILGNCIVSGNETIGEGCLCARMSAENQDLIAQQVEEITPCPQQSW